MSKYNAYRADIDGLRALAVGAVVVFHAFPFAMPGGYVGVDVFFVISGFLITSIIERSIKEQSFTFADFYGRRIRRIVPALSLVLATCLTYGWLDLLNTELVDLGRHVAGGAAFISNWILHKESVLHGGYFDKSAELKPLLHLWSLGIEEQFYLLWPPIVIYAMHRKWRIGRVALTLGAVSFALNLGLISSFKEATFYLPMTRLWELLIGCAMASTPLPNFKPYTKNVLSVIGLALILVATISFDASQAYPGWRALLPVLGTALVIASGCDAWPNQNLLSMRPLVGIGLVSYPLYLWHWPVLYFTRLDTSFSLTARSVAVFASLALACATYFAVEQPIRRRKTVFRLPTIAALVGILAIVGICGKVIAKVEPKGWLYRGATTVQDLNSLIQDQNLATITKVDCPSETAKAEAYWCRTDHRGTPTALVY